MHPIGLALVVRLALALSSLWLALAPQEPVFRSGARTVAIYVTVTDSDGQQVVDLTKEDFEVYDNGRRQPLTVFENGLQPITVVVMLDRSGSMRGNVGLVGRAAEEFVRRLAPGDTARIGSFADRIDIQPGSFTDDKDTLLRILQYDRPVTGPTPLWNAIDEAIAALRGRDGRKVVLVFSDGGDAPSNFRLDNHSIMDVMRTAQRDDVMVYAIGLQTTVLRGPGGRGGMGSLTGAMTSVRPDPGLARVADDTGGGYFELTRADDLSDTFAAVADELHHQYALGFEPPKLDDRMHKVDVRANRKGLKVRARTEYFAARPPSDTAPVR